MVFGFAKVRQTSNLVLRYTSAVVLAGIILWIVGAIVNALGEFGVIVGIVTTIIVGTVYYQMITKLHPGTEPLLGTMVAIIVGIAGVQLLTIIMTWLGITVTLPTFELALGLNLNFLLGLTSFWIADTLLLKLKYFQ